MQRVVVRVMVVVAVAAAVASSPGAAQEAARNTPGALDALQGRWVVTGAEHNGRPLDAIKGGVMTVAGSAFEIRTAAGTIVKGTLRVDGSRAPAHMDLVHADGAIWEAVYEVSGDTFRINYVEAGGKDPRPAAFTTSPDTEESLVILRREPR
jgi:uncharacterized protein (TIGR03067 family)